MVRAVIVWGSFGVLAFDESNELVDYVLFPKDPRRTAEVLLRVEGEKLVDEIRELVERLRRSGYDVFVFEDAGLAGEVRGALGVEVEFSRPCSAGEAFRADVAGFAVRTGFVGDSGEFSLWVHKLSLEIAKLRVRGAVEKRDLVVAQAVQTLDDLDRTINLFMGRIREWYGIHFPEFDRLVDKHEAYARLVLELGGRENFSVERLVENGVPRARAEQIAKAAASSMGADISETDLVQVQALCRNVLGLYELRQGLEGYLDVAMEEVAPNTKALVGPVLGARLIALSGGLENLAKMPASTIQVLGAEKALFRSLKTGSRPPKHGIIFQHAFLHDAKRWHRGKIARALAGKLAIAVRADAFGGRHLGDELKVGLERRVVEIREKYAEPPTVVEKKPKRERRERRGRWKRAGKG